MSRVARFRPSWRSARDPRREEAQRQRVRRGNLQYLALLAFDMVQVTHHLAELLDHVARTDQKQLTGLGQFDGRARTVDQLQAQGLFQRTDAPTERRLGDEAALRRLGEAAGCREGDEVFQPLGFRFNLKLLDTMATNGKSHAHYAVSAWDSQATALAAHTPQALF